MAKLNAAGTFSNYQDAMSIVVNITNCVSYSTMTFHLFKFDIKLCKQYKISVR